MNPDSRLLIVEMVLPDGNTPHPGKILDMVMLVAPGGQERTEREYGTLLEKAVPTPPTGGAHRVSSERCRGRSFLRIVIRSQQRSKKW
jgi:hypothetical protein